MTPTVVRVVADIGGTNTRIARGSSSGITHLARYENDDAGSFDQCLDDYLARHAPQASAVSLRLAVAAPVQQNRARLTNRDWHIDGAALARRYGFADVVLVNDFAALALSLPHLAGADLLHVSGPETAAPAPRLVLGPGTGFGAALLLANGVVVATEGGHAWLAPRNAEEAAVLAVLRGGGPVATVERAVCGAGLERLYRAIAGSRRGAETDAAAVFARALGGDDPFATEAVDTFYRFLGTATRTLALATGASGGVYLAGGILPRYPDALLASRFDSWFRAPPAPTGYLESIPCWLVVHDAPALPGLAAMDAPPPP